jgi:hypothetical protein
MASNNSGAVGADAILQQTQRGNRFNEHRTDALILMPRGDVDATPRVVRECRETACAYGFEGHRDG